MNKEHDLKLINDFIKDLIGDLELSIDADDKYLQSLPPEKDISNEQGALLDSIHFKIEAIDMLHDVVFPRIEEWYDNYYEENKED